jgi:hypothetical protein
MWDINHRPYPHRGPFVFGAPVLEQVLAIMDVFELVQRHSIIELSWKMGAITASAYHFTLQYPSQADLFKCLWAYAVFNALFLIGISLAYRGTNWSDILIGVVTFNCVFVRPEYKNTDRDIPLSALQSRV